MAQHDGLFFPAGIWETQERAPLPTRPGVPPTLGGPQKLFSVLGDPGLC